MMHGSMNIKITKHDYTWIIILKLNLDQEYKAVKWMKVVQNEGQKPT